MKTRTPYFVAVLLTIASLLLSSCAALAPAQPTPTNAPVLPSNTPKPTATAIPTSTVTPTITPTPTVTPNATATQQVEQFAAKVKQYHDAGYVSTTDGSYDYLGDISYSWAEIGYYNWHKTKFSPTDFIIKSEVTWNSASAAADSSGCGFVFRIQSNQDHYMFYLSLKGYVEAATNVGNRWNPLGRGSFGIAAQRGTATVTLIVEGSTFRALVDDKLVKAFTGLAGKLTTGDLAYTVLSGTNKGYGTSCDFKNTELWTIKH
jgi:hypothetical protein